MSNPADIRLIVCLKDGRRLSGVYHWASALERLNFARNLPNYSGFAFTHADD